MLFLKQHRRDYHGVHVDPARVKKQERASKFKKFLNALYTFIILSTLLWLVYFILYSPIFKIKNINISGNENLTQEEIQQTVSKVLASKKYRIIPQDTFFTLSIDTLYSTLSENFTLAHLKITKKFPHDLNITLEEKLASLNFCIEDESKCYYVNYDGLITKRVGDNQLNSNSHILFYRPLSQERTIGETATSTTTTTPDTQNQLPRIMIGKTKIPTNIVRFVLELFEAFNNNEIKGVGLQDMEISSLDSYTKKIIVNTTLGYQIYFNCDRPINEQLNNLNTILTKKIKGEYENLEYIDLRFGNQVYYK